MVPDKRKRPDTSEQMCQHYHVQPAGSAWPQDQVPVLGVRAAQQQDRGHPAKQQKAVSILPLRKPPLGFFVCFQAFSLKTEDIKWFHVISRLGKFKLSF